MECSTREPALYFQRNMYHLYPLLRVRGDDLRRLCLQHPETGTVFLDRLATVIAERLNSTHDLVLSLLQLGLTTTSKERRMTYGYPNQCECPHRGTGARARPRLSAYIEQFHGGSVEFISFDGKVLKVHLGGACLGCPLSPNTLHGWVEGTVKQFFPEIEKVESDI